MLDKHALALRSRIRPRPRAGIWPRERFEKRVTLAWEFSRASRGEPKPGFWYDAAMSAIRGVGFALGAAYLFGATFGALSAVGQVIAYRVGIRPDWSA